MTLIDGQGEGASVRSFAVVFRGRRRAPTLPHRFQICSSRCKLLSVVQRRGLRGQPRTCLLKRRHGRATVAYHTLPSLPQRRARRCHCPRLFAVARFLIVPVRQSRRQLKVPGAQDVEIEQGRGA
ncbi:hypothetical protein AAHA92_11979 [Salvia divinorum]|uniref:Uncharacterized protein n=1 Tax=Salvia divinorum TaxID=28513 RepID=A0ABD1HIQ5_SALDI